MYVAKTKGHKQVHQKCKDDKIPSTHVNKVVMAA